MHTLLDDQHIYMVGIKGVAMTALAQCLIDAGKDVRGSDVPEKFVTQPALDRLGITVDESFDAQLPTDTQCVVYTSAHNSWQNPQVAAARERGIPTLTHAEALAQLFNRDHGIAVCGVGGKSTTSAMITWILVKLGIQPNFAIGVGNIPGLEKTGQWSKTAQYFVAEADEYVTDPSAPSRGEEITPRFSFLHPFVTVCTNMRHDHPDVYSSFEETKKHFVRFFNHIQPQGSLIAHSADKAVYDEMEFWPEQQGRSLVWFGEQGPEDVPTNHPAFLLEPSTFSAKDGQTSCQVSTPHLGHTATLTLQLPGMYNLRNAVAAIAACTTIGITLEDAVRALAGFRSTQRRCEYIGEKHGVKYYDDYGHHPHEVASVIHAYRQWFPDRKLVIGFQSHTFTRTKQFFNEFVDAFAQADEVAMIDIFASAREAFDPNVTSDQLCAAIQEKHPQVAAHNFKTVDALAQHCQATLEPGDVFLTVGAGNIYQVHDLIR